MGWWQEAEGRSWGRVCSLQFPRAMSPAMPAAPGCEAVLGAGSFASPPHSGSFVLSAGLVGCRWCPGHCPEPGLPPAEPSGASVVGKADWERLCAPRVDHPGSLEQPGACGGNWGCPRLPALQQLPRPELRWCWRSSAGSRKWGRVSPSPGTRRALLLPGKQSGSRNRALSSMAILRPREGASLGAAQRVLCQCGCPVTPSAWQ